MPRRQANADPDDPAPALTRGLDLLVRLGRDGPQLLERLAGDAGLPKSSTLRLLAALERSGMVARDPLTRRWHARVALIAGRDGASEAARMRQVLADLARSVHHAAELWEWRGDRAVMVDRADPEDASTAVRARIGFERGLREVDAVVLIGFACAAAGPRWQALHVQCRDRTEQRVSRAELQIQVDASRASGFAADAGVNAHGVRRFAVPWYGADGTLRGALVVAQGGGVPPGREDGTIEAALRAAGRRLAS